MPDEPTAGLLSASHEAATAHGDPALTYLDTGGHPASVRVRVAQAADGLDLTLPEGAPEPAAGPANLLAHSHNEDMWDLEQTMVRGQLRTDGGAARFVPAKVVQGARPGLLNGIKVLRRCRHAAAAELERRGLARPSVRWDGVARVAERLRAS